MAITVRPAILAATGEPGESDEDPGMDVDRMVEEFGDGSGSSDPPPPVRARRLSPHGPDGGVVGQAPGPQATERSVTAGPGPPATKEKSEEELEQERSTR